MSNCYVNVCGGIGNQLFQIATGYAYSRENNKDLWINSLGWSASQGNHPRDYRDNIFTNFDYDYINPSEKITNITESREMMYDKLPVYDGSVELTGYFQAHEYFKDYMQEFEDILNLPEIVKDYIEPHSVAFHIRRGDYAQFEHIFGNIYPYFHKLFEEFKGEDIHVYTDSPDEISKEFSNYDFRIFRQSSDLKDLTAISHYDRVACSNSSFSWWASALGGKKSAVIVPDKWINGKEHSGIYRPDMIIRPTT